MSRLLLQHHETICFVAHAQGVVRMALCGDVHLKQLAVIEFLVVEKESVMYIHRQLKMYTETVLLIKALLVVIGLHELLVLRNAKQSSVMRLAQADQRQQSLRRCCNVLMN
jgi:hypothetical protein